MRKILIVTHGELAKGLESACRFFMSGMLGDNVKISSLCAFTETCPKPKEAIDKFFQETKESDEVVCLTDMLGGSVNQWVSYYVKRPHTTVFSGTNLPLLLSLVTLSPEEYLTDADLDNLESEGKAGVVCMNHMKADASSEDE